MPLKKIKRLEEGGRGGRSASPSDAWVTISNSFFTLVARSSSTSVPVCLALSYDRLLGRLPPDAWDKNNNNKKSGGGHLSTLTSRSP